MNKLCLTAGTEIPDIIWSANVLIALRRANPALTLSWECPRVEISSWLESYPELDAVICDLEEADAPAPDYLILHPLWCKAKTAGPGPIGDLYMLADRWCNPPDPLPVRPYLPPSLRNLTPPPGLPEGYLCLDPSTGGRGALGETLTTAWTNFIAHMGLPVVQVGWPEASQLPGSIDARGCGAGETARLACHARLCLGADGDLSCLAHALQKRQIWLEVKHSSWWWPRGEPPLCVRHRMETLEDLDILALYQLAQGLLAAPESGHGQ